MQNQTEHLRLIRNIQSDPPPPFPLFKKKILRFKKITLIFFSHSHDLIYITFYIKFIILLFILLFLLPLYAKRAQNLGNKSIYLSRVNFKFQTLSHMKFY